VFVVKHQVGNFSAILLREQVTFDIDGILVLAHWNNSPRTDMSLHSDTLSWFLANQSLLLLLNAAHLPGKQEVHILYYICFDPTGARTRNIQQSKRAR